MKKKHMTAKEQKNKQISERSALIRIGATGISLTVIEKRGRKVDEVHSVFFQSFPYGDILISEGVIHQFHHIIPLFRKALEELIVLLAREKNTLDEIHIILEEPYAYVRMYEFEFDRVKIPEQKELLASIETDELEAVYESKVDLFSFRELRISLNGHPINSSFLKEVKKGEVKMVALVSFSKETFLSELREELQGHFPLIEAKFSSRAELFGFLAQFLTQKEEDHFHLIDINSLSTNIVTYSPSGYFTFSSFSDGSLHIINRVAQELSYPFYKTKHLFLKRWHEHFYESHQEQFQSILLKSLREWESMLYTHLSSILNEAELSPKVFYYTDTLLIEENVGAVFEDPLFIDAFFPKRGIFVSKSMLSELLSKKGGMEVRKSISHQHLPAFLAFHPKYITKRYGSKKEKN